MTRLLACLLLATLPAHAGVQLWVAGESEKVRPSATLPSDARTSVRLAAAGGECAAAQIVVRAAEGIRGFTASTGPLTSQRGPAVPLELSRVATIVLEKPSGPEGSTGEWPDALIPVRDAIWGETRHAFPVDVLPQRAQALFVEACAPRGRPGRYAGAVHLGWIGEKGALVRAKVPVELQVRGFDLPATPPLVTAFGFSGWSAARGHGLGPEAATELTRLYHLMALRRGITLFGGTQAPPAYTVAGDTVHIDWTAYDAEVAPFLDGTALPSGARWTATELREWPKLTRAQRKSWRRAWVEHFRARGWLDRLFVYVEDEPPPEVFPRVEARARELREDAPEVRRLVTTSMSAKLPSIDLWTPPMYCTDPVGVACPWIVPRARYDKLWWYQACMSHGCGPIPPGGQAAFIGWPSYAIDAPATAARVMGWLAFANDISGELYFDVVYEYDHGDPWQTQWAFYGNGDGTLYYPGTPKRIGGEHHVPIESLRLVQIQRSLQDHAYLVLCSRLGDPKLAQAEARALAPSLLRWSRDPKAYAAARERLAARIETLSAEKRAAATQR